MIFDPPPSTPRNVLRADPRPNSTAGYQSLGSFPTFCVTSFVYLCHSYGKHPLKFLKMRGSITSLILFFATEVYD